MSIIAKVYCRCWEDGLTTEPPVARELVERPNLVEDEGPALRVRGGLGERPDVAGAFEAWLDDHACEHRCGIRYFEKFGRWDDYPQLLQALVSAGTGAFPVLGTSPSPLGPQGGMRPTPTELSARIAAELRALRDHPEQFELGERARLVDAATGEWVRTVPDGAFQPVHSARTVPVRVRGTTWEPTPPWGDTGFAREPRVELALSVDPDGFVVSDLAPWYATDYVGLPPELFRAARVAVTVEPGPAADPQGRMMPTTVTGLDTGDHLTAAMELPFQRDGEHRYEVTVRPREPADFEIALEAVLDLYETSEETGHPVLWF